MITDNNVVTFHSIYKTQAQNNRAKPIIQAKIKKGAKEGHYHGKSLQF